MNIFGKVVTFSRGKLNNDTQRITAWQNEAVEYTSAFVTNIHNKIANEITNAVAMTDEERESKQGSIDIRKLPGYEVNIRLTSFIDAILVCNANAVSFRKWHDKINTSALVVMLKEPANYSLRHETNLELQRQFSNFLMSAFAVRDHWYALRNEYYIGTAVNEKINAFTSETFCKEICIFFPACSNEKHICDRFPVRGAGKCVIIEPDNEKSCPGAAPAARKQKGVRANAPALNHRR